MGSSLSEGGRNAQLVSGRHFPFIGHRSSPTWTEVGSERLKSGQPHIRTRRLAIVVHFAALSKERSMGTLRVCQLRSGLSKRIVGSPRIQRKLFRCTPHPPYILNGVNMHVGAHFNDANF